MSDFSLRLRTRVRRVPPLRLRDIAAPLALSLVFALAGAAGIAEPSALLLAAGAALALQAWLRIPAIVRSQDGAGQAVAIAVLVLLAGAVILGAPTEVLVMYGLTAYLTIRLARALTEVRLAEADHALPPRRRRATVRAQTASIALAASLALSAIGDPAIWVGGVVLLRLVLHPVHWIAMRGTARGDA
ncbi:hypothetical protein [Wenxinia marina]|uniref:Uncharacterized protein n=1 Tax=Wenxinia marina DSM 24838 TaxID=1123501 RepID=A0A0D0Q6S5_9RHOB|nr:hypothetical protein [Wenxinia marina]KIQ68137.1 hypothetical protein Wenmar_03353 [Wenxinia marina DSM 24838]GGL78589.1 hypothetical protein GCM10011392_36310 [Wenxinia marina]